MTGHTPDGPISALGSKLPPLPALLPLLLLLLGEHVELVKVLVVQWTVTVTGGGGLYDSLTEVVSLITRYGLLGSVKMLCVRYRKSRIAAAGPSLPASPSPASNNSVDADAALAALAASPAASARLSKRPRTIACVNLTSVPFLMEAVCRSLKI